MVGAIEGHRGGLSNQSLTLLSVQFFLRTNRFTATIWFAPQSDSEVELFLSPFLK